MIERAAPAVPASASTWLLSGRLRDVVLNLAVAGGYWAVAELTLLVSPARSTVVLLWAPSGFAVATMLLGGVRLLPGVAFGALLTFFVHSPVAIAVAMAAGSALEAFVDLKLLRRLSFDERLERVRDVINLSLLAAPAGSLVAALIGASAAVFTEQRPPSELPFLIAGLWVRSWLGVVVVVSLVITWVSRSAKVEQPGPQVSASRFRPVVAATLVATVAAASALAVALGLEPSNAFPANFARLIPYRLVLLAFSIACLAVAAVMAEAHEGMLRRLALEEQLRHAQKMEAIGRLAGGIAHDFNNLLTAIIGYTEILSFGFEPQDPRRADAEEIKRAAERAAELTRQMLAFSRRQVLQPQVVDLNVAMQKVEPMLRRVIGEDIVMTISAKASKPLVRVDPGQIEQVIMNLVVNARDAMPKGGPLTVETDDTTVDASMVPPRGRQGDYIRLSVSDTGIGMSPEVRARIFEPYFTTKDVGKGTGLGLSTAYGIVQQSDGFIQVYSEPGLGTTFRIHLPRSEGDPNTVETDLAQTMPGGNEHLLLVEDDPTVRRATRETLIRLGYSVTEAASGRAGLALGSDDTRHFDLALCDVILGDMSGPAVYEALRALRPSVRVLYMSGYADEAIVRTGVLDDGHPFLQKPFTPKELAVKIRNVLDSERE